MILPVALGLHFLYAVGKNLPQANAFSLRSTLAWLPKPALGDAFPAGKKCQHEPLPEAVGALATDERSIVLEMLATGVLLLTSMNVASVLIYRKTYSRMALTAKSIMLRREALERHADGPLNRQCR